MLFKGAVCVLGWVCVNMCVVFEVYSFWCISVFMQLWCVDVWPTAQQVFAEHLLCVRAAVNQ